MSNEAINTNEAQMLLAETMREEAAKPIASVWSTVESGVADLERRLANANDRIAVIEADRANVEEMLADSNAALRQATGDLNQAKAALILLQDRLHEEQARRVAAQDDLMEEQRHRRDAELSNQILREINNGEVEELKRQRVGWWLLLLVLLAGVLLGWALARNYYADTTGPTVIEDATTVEELPELELR